MKRWYALHTRPHAETRIAAHLTQREIETFVPGVDGSADSGGARFHPLFPGYLFIYLNLQRERGASWMNFPGVRYLLAYDSEPVSIPDEAISVLRKRVGELRTAREQSGTRFKPGELVRIKDGPFRDMLAIFEGPDGNGQRVRVLLQALERSMRLQLSPSKLDVVDERKNERKKKRPRRTRGRGRRIRN